MIEWAKGISRAITRAADALEALVHATQKIYIALQELGGSPDGLEARIEQLERQRALWEAEIDGKLLQAENKFKAARASEERTRRLSESFGGDEDGLDELPAGIRELYRGDAEAGREEGVPAVRPDVGSDEQAGERVPSLREKALALKLGR